MLIIFWEQNTLQCNHHQNLWSHSDCFFALTDLWQVSKQLSEEYEKIVNPEKAAEDTKPVKIKEEPVSDITFPISEELEGDLASGDQSLPVGVLGAQSERFSANLEVEASPQTSGRGFLLLLETVYQLFHVILFPFLIADLDVRKKEKIFLDFNGKIWMRDKPFLAF